jgi:hypothetical protein
MTRLFDALDGPWDIKSPIGSTISLGEGMFCHAMIPPATIPSHEPHVKTLVPGGRFYIHEHINLVLA